MQSDTSDHAGGVGAAGELAAMGEMVELALSPCWRPKNDPPGKYPPEVADTPPKLATDSRRLEGWWWPTGGGSKEGYFGTNTTTEPSMQCETSIPSNGARQEGDATRDLPIGEITWEETRLDLLAAVARDWRRLGIEQPSATNSATCPCHVETAPLIPPSVMGEGLVKEGAALHIGS